MIIPSVLEKASFGVAVLVLFLQQRVSPVLFGAGIIDLLFGLLFIVAYFKIDRAKLS